MKKILNIKYPVITTYTHHAHLLAILGADDRTKEWIFSNYIQIYINKDLKCDSWADFYFPMPYEIKAFELCKWIETQKIHEHFIDKKYTDIIEYIENAVNDNYYVHLMANYKYLSESQFSKRNVDKRHDMLIWGYDSEQNRLYCADFMLSAGKYSFFECTYDELRAAYNNEYVKKKESYLNHYLYAYRIRNECDYQYSPNNIVYWLKQYVYGNEPEYWAGYNYENSKNIVWGLDYYDVLCENLQNTEWEQIDYRLYCLLKDHKVIMIERLIFLEETGLSLKKCIEVYEILLKTLSLIVNLVLKYNITKDKRIAEKIVNKLKECKEKEYVTLYELIEKIEKCINEKHI